MDGTARADLTITKTDSPDPVIAGTNVVYTIKVTNNGPSNVANAVVTDTLPTAATVFVSAVPSSGTCTQAAGIGTCNLGPMTAGQYRDHRRHRLDQLESGHGDVRDEHRVRQRHAHRRSQSGEQHRDRGDDARTIC